MSDVDWSKAPEGATHATSGECEDIVMWYRTHDGSSYEYYSCDGTWVASTNSAKWLMRNLTRRATAPKPYTRDEALQFLVERLDAWPTDIADAPLCPGWGWSKIGTSVAYVNDVGTAVVWPQNWQAARPAFQHFVSVEDAQPVPDMVNHPPHYQSDTGVECIDAIRAALGAKGFQAYCIGNTMKYLWREKSDKAEDLRKAAWYLNRALSELE